MHSGHPFMLVTCSEPHGKNFHFQDAIFRVIAAILHLGNIKFAKGNETDSSEPQDDQSKFHLKTAAELLMYMIFVYSLFF